MNGVPSWQPFLGTYYGTCSTAQATKDKVVILTNGDGFSLTAGTTVAVKFTNASAAATMTLAFQYPSGTTVGTKKQVYQYGSAAMSSGVCTTGWIDGAIVLFIYDGTYWFRQYWYNNQYYLTAYTDTAAGTAAKVGYGIGNYTIQKGHFAFFNVNSNSVAQALTLNICGEGALPIWLNGQASSSTNYTFPAGYYIGYCDGTKYYFNTNGDIPGIGINLWSVGQEIAEGTNIDTDIVTPGTYYSINGPRTQTLHGQLPDWGCGFKLINAATYSENYIKQFVMDSSFSLLYRHLAKSNGVWTYGVWKTLAHIDSTIDSTTGAAVWSAVGSTTKPVYVTRDGVITAGKTYAGGTCVTLNGTSKAESTATIYAPTTAGTSGQFLKSNGSGAPEWAAVPGIEIVRW